MTDETTNVRRDVLFTVRMTATEKALVFAGARLAASDSASAWVRRVLVDAARDSFRGALRPAAERLREEEAGDADTVPARGPAPVPEEVEA